MSVVKTAIKQPVLVNLLFALVLIAGVIYGSAITKELFPEVNPPGVMVTAAYPGVSAEEMEKLVTRPKTGFGVPLDSWLRGPLRDWAEGLLSQSRLKEEGFFAPATVRRAWKEHLSGRRNHQHKLWAVLMFQAWHMGEHSLN